MHEIIPRIDKSLGKGKVEEKNDDTVDPSQWHWVEHVFIGGV